MSCIVINCAILIYSDLKMRLRCFIDSCDTCFLSNPKLKKIQKEQATISAVLHFWAELCIRYDKSKLFLAVPFDRLRAVSNLSNPPKIIAHFIWQS